MAEPDVVLQYLSLAEASRRTRFCDRTFRRAIKAKRLIAHRIGRRLRIDIRELERWMRADGSAPVSATP